MSTQAYKRLNKEYKQIQANPPPYIVARPSEANILDWHYVITGPPGTPYENGQYHGRITFPSEYPFKPPRIKMCTPSGRFEINQRLCLSMSDFHEESWNPSWSVATIITGLLSFMTGDERTTGSIVTSVQTKKQLAIKSMEYNTYSNIPFKEVFPDIWQQNLIDLQNREMNNKNATKNSNNGLNNGSSSGKADEVEIIKDSDIDNIIDPEDRIRARLISQTNRNGKVKVINDTESKSISNNDNNNNNDTSLPLNLYFIVILTIVIGVISKGLGLI